MRAALAILAALAVLPATATPEEEENNQYAVCEPYCIAFKQLGDLHAAIAVDSAGEFVAWTPVEGVAGPVLSAAEYVLPGIPHQYRGSDLERGGCKYRVAREQYETVGEHVTVVTITTRCNGRLVDVVVPVVSVPKAD